MTTDRELLQKIYRQYQLGNLEPKHRVCGRIFGEIEAELAKPEAEPVCYAPKNIVEILGRNPPSHIVAVKKERGDSNRFTLPLYAHPQPERKSMTVIDIADDDALRFVQRVLESDAPEADRLAAREMITGIRTRVRKIEQPEQDQASSPRPYNELPSHPMFDAFIRAFWRRIDVHKNDFGKELPEEMPVQFRANMETALLVFDKNKDGC